MPQLVERRFVEGLSQYRGLTREQLLMRVELDTEEIWRQALLIGRLRGELILLRRQLEELRA